MNNKKILIGFSNLDENNVYARKIRENLEAEAEKHPQIELMIRNNDLDTDKAKQHVQEFADVGVDVAVIYHVDERENPRIVAPLIANNIPFISVDLYIPMSIYLGADSAKGAELGGAQLGNWIKQNWNGQLDKLLVMTYQQVLSVAQIRFDHSTRSLKQIVPYQPGQMLYLDTGIEYAETHERLSRVLEGWYDQNHIAVICINDKTAERVLRIARETGRIDDIAVLSFDGTEIAIEEFKRDDCRMVASALFKQGYFGEKLIDLSLQIAAGERVPRRNLVEPILLTQENYMQHVK